MFIEDIDVYAGQENEQYQTRLSNLFDGVGSKGDQVMLVMTSNKAANFSKGMLRAGRVDRMIEVGPLDRDATEEMIRRVIGVERLDKRIDFDQVHEALQGFEPAFVRSTFDQAAEAAIIRTKSLTYTLGTEDFVGAAVLLRPQHEMHTNKGEPKKTTFDTAMRDLVRESVRDLVGDVELSGDYDLQGSVKFQDVVHNN